MASNKQEEVCVTVTWKIQNFGLLLEASEKDPLLSPLWKVMHTQGSDPLKRFLIYPWGSFMFFGLFDQRTKLPVDLCEMSLLSTRGDEVRLKGGCQWMFHIERDALFGARRQSVLPEDTLTLRCRMWEKTTRAQHFSLSSVLRNMILEWNFEHSVKEQLSCGCCCCDYSNTIEKDNMEFDIVVGVAGSSSSAFKVAAGSSRFKVMVEAIPNADSWHSFVKSKVVTIGTHSPYGRWTYEYNYMHTITRQSVDYHPAVEGPGSFYFQLKSIIALHDGNQPQLPQYSMSDNTLNGDQGQLTQRKKRKCAEVLEAGLTTENACDALVLAERHSDGELKDGIVEFIFNHQEVLSSSQWEIFEESYPRLAAKILREIVLKKGKK